MPGTYFLLPTSYFLLPTCYLLLTTYLLLGCHVAMDASLRVREAREAHNAFRIQGAESLSSRLQVTCTSYLIHSYTPTCYFLPHPGR